jgi:DNA repair exonuclease SbcCD ATPase subunit
VLYARDGSVVSGDPPARAAGAGPVHDVGAREGTRMYLLELYQSTVEEKEALQRETEGLQATITRAAETQASVEKERDAAVARAAALEKELAQARSENGELAARLVTAQIRRLEAEKLLLEARIEALRRGEAASAKTTPASAPATPRPEEPKPAHGGR